MKISGQLADVHQRRIYPAEIEVVKGLVAGIRETASAPQHYILPGLIDSHIHIESSMVTPRSFAVAAVSRGTTSVVSDPHEIANVMGTEGVKFMIEDASCVPLKFYFGAPSCVPATAFESAGAEIAPADAEELLKMPQVKYLAEMMNYPGVIYDDPGVLKKISAARKSGKPVDGHAPGLTGSQLEKYVSAGISTDHECTSIAEAREKISLGMKILIREGSAARNLDELKPLFKTDPAMLMLCSDDLHPEMLVKQHINKLVSRLVSEGYDLFDVLRSCTVNPIRHYSLESGVLAIGDPADFILVDDPRSMNVFETWIDGKKVFDRGEILFSPGKSVRINNFNCTGIIPDSLELRPEKEKMRVIEAFDGSLVTKELIINHRGMFPLTADTQADLLKVVVKDRYGDRPPAAGFIKGFGLTSGAFAGSVSHDSHNIICIGTNDEDIINAVNRVISMRGGLAVSDGSYIDSMPLPVGGIMSDDTVVNTASSYERLSSAVKSMGCSMSAPFMTLSFMALLVIPELKLSDRGLFNGNIFSNVPLFCD